MAYIGREETRTQGLAGKQEETSEKTWMVIKMDLNEIVLDNNAQPAGHMWSAEGYVCGQIELSNTFTSTYGDSCIPRGISHVGIAQ
jgi:hypothetical protein